MTQEPFDMNEFLIEYIRTTQGEEAAKKAQITEGKGGSLHAIIPDDVPLEGNPVPDEIVISPFSKFYAWFNKFRSGSK